MPANADRPSVGQSEAADIGGVGGGMLTAHVPPKQIAGNVAAGIAAVALDGSHLLAEHFLGQRLHLVLEPQGQGHGCFAGELVEPGAHAGRRNEANAIVPAAAVLDGTVGNGLRLDIGRLERARADLGIVPDAGQAPIDRPGAWPCEVDERQRIEGRRHQALPEQDRRARRDQDEQQHAWPARAPSRQLDSAPSHAAHL